MNVLRCRGATSGGQGGAGDGVLCFECSRYVLWMLCLLQDPAHIKLKASIAKLCNSKAKDECRFVEQAKRVEQLKDKIALMRAGNWLINVSFVFVCASVSGPLCLCLCSSEPDVPLCICHSAVVPSPLYRSPFVPLCLQVHVSPPLGSTARLGVISWLVAEKAATITKS